MGISLLLLSASTSQQTVLLELGKAPLATVSDCIELTQLASFPQKIVKLFKAIFAQKLYLCKFFLAEFYADCNIYKYNCEGKKYKCRLIKKDSFQNKLHQEMIMIYFILGIMDLKL